MGRNDEKRIKDSYEQFCQKEEKHPGIAQGEEENV